MMCAKCHVDHFSNSRAAWSVRDIFVFSTTLLIFALWDIVTWSQQSDWIVFRLLPYKALLVVCAMVCAVVSMGSLYIAVARCWTRRKIQ
jgi:hypothetical protein